MFRIEGKSLCVHWFALYVTDFTEMEFLWLKNILLKQCLNDFTTALIMSEKGV